MPIICLPVPPSVEILDFSLVDDDINKTGVMALMGRMPDSPGRIQMRLHSNAVTAPHSKVIGNKVLWFDVPNNSRAI